MNLTEFKDYPISIALDCLRDRDFELVDVINANKYQLINYDANMTLLIETYIPDDDVCESVNRIYLINEICTDFNLTLNQHYYEKIFLHHNPINPIKFYQHYETLYQFKL
jgi:hypothetical protein